MMLFLMCAPWAGNLPCYCDQVPKLINDPNVSCACPWGQKQGVADSRPFSCSCNPGFHAQGNGTTFVDCFKCHKPNCNSKRILGWSHLQRPVINVSMYSNIITYND